VTASYTAVSGDTLTSIGTGIANAVSSNATLQAVGLSATSGYVSGVGQYYVSVNPAIPTYTAATNGGATETVTVGQSSTPNTTLVIGNRRHYHSWRHS
jgi:hypothetical protein